MGEGASTLIMLAAMFAIFYFLLIRPQQKRLKEHREMITRLRKGDQVTTNGGLIGKITRVYEEELTLEIADGVRVRVQRGAISDVKAKTEPAPAANDRGDDDDDDDEDDDASDSKAKSPPKDD